MDPVEPVPAEVGPGLEAYRNGDLNDAFWRSHPRGTGPARLVPWVSVRIGELLAMVRRYIGLA